LSNSPPIKQKSEPLAQPNKVEEKEGGVALEFKFEDDTSETPSSLAEIFKLKMQGFESKLKQREVKPRVEKKELTKEELF